MRDLQQQDVMYISYDSTTRAIGTKAQHILDTNSRLEAGALALPAFNSGDGRICLRLNARIVKK